MQSKIRKRRCSASSLSPLMENDRRRQELLVAKTSPSSPQNEKCTTRGPEEGSKTTKSARKLASEHYQVNEPMNIQSATDLNLSQNFRYTIPVPAEKINRHRRHSSSLLLTDKNLAGMHSYGARVFEDETRSCDETNNEGRLVPGVIICLKEVNNMLTTSKQLLKLLNHIWSSDEKQNQVSTSTSLVSALKYELNRARAQVDKLIQDQRSKNTNNLLKQFAEERAAWKMKEQERIRAAVRSMARELQVERKLRRQTERLNKKLGSELETTKASLSEVMKEVESEKRAREILEQVCEELTRGIEEDRAKFEELRKESERVREEVEKEREMLQVADILREERVHMKLLEAKYELEEKHEQVNKLKNDLEEFLKANSSNVSPEEESIRLLEECLKEKLEGLSPSDDKENDKIERSSEHVTIVPLERFNSDCIEWDFTTKKYNEVASNGCLQDKQQLEFPSIAEIKEYEDELERYKIIKDLRDHIVSGSGLASCQGFLKLQEAT